MAEQYPNPIGAAVETVIFDCHNPGELAAFYAKLLGGKVESDPYGGYSVTVRESGLSLGFQQDPFYQRPIWLGNPGDQQPMAHLDIKVRNRREAVDFAIAIGAVLPEKQVCQPDWPVPWTTLLDPAGHPFCFFE